MATNEQQAGRLCHVLDNLERPLCGSTTSKGSPVHWASECPGFGHVACPTCDSLAELEDIEIEAGAVR
jgi:hypothetical protein